MRENHIQATSAQMSHRQASSGDRTQFASVNHGKPPTAAMNRVCGSRFIPQGVRQPIASTAEHPNNVNRQNRNIANQPQEERDYQARPQKRMQKQARVHQTHEQQHARSQQKRERGDENHG